MSTSAVNISSMFTSFLALQNIKRPSEFYKLFSAVFPPKLREQCTNIFTVYRVITYSLSVQTKKEHGCHNTSQTTIPLASFPPFFSVKPDAKQVVLCLLNAPVANVSC